MTDCPCGTGRAYSECCEPLITGARPAGTAEELMRSRYTAYVRAEVDYLLSTIHPSKRTSHDPKAMRKWSEGADWLGLEILACTGGGSDDDTGTVEFVARYRENQRRQEYREIAEFKKVDGVWYFYDGNSPVIPQIVRNAPKIGRNDPCPCGSGKKYKKCCGR